MSRAPSRLGRVRPRRRRLATLVIAIGLVTSFVPGAATAGISDAPPSTITVCRSSGAVQEVAFGRYVKEVLAKEFPSSWPMETLKAGAVAIKSYAWYFIAHPYRPGHCHISDTTRHQKYHPEDPTPGRTERGDRAVDATWDVVMTELRDGERTPAFAQYCASCGGFPPGEHLDQWDAKAMGDDGATYTQILRHHYRNKDRLRIFDWREDLEITIDGEPPVPAEEGTVIEAPVRGVPADYPDAAARLSVECTIDGRSGRHHLQTVGLRAGDDGARAVFDAVSRMRACEETEATGTTELVVGGDIVDRETFPVWEPWRSSVRRPVERFVTSDPVTASVALSREVFADRTGAQDDTPIDIVTSATGPTTAEGRRDARAVVIARSDRFADALSASGLAGADAPILLNPGGDAPLDDRVADEIARVLDDAETVHLVGGTAALSRRLEDDPRLDAYEVVRHAGRSRVETSLAVADAVRDRGGDGSVVLVARALPDTTAGWADAIAAGGYAAARGHPILLTDTRTLSPATETWIESNAVTEAVLLGGPAAVPADAERRLSTTTTRIAGDTRDATALRIVEELWARPGTPEVTGALIVDAWQEGTWPFGLVASVVAADRGLVTLAVTHLVPRATTGRWLDANPDAGITIVGDGTVVASRTERDLTGS